MKIYREVGSLYIVNRKDAEGYVRPVYEIEVAEAELVRHGKWIFIERREPQYDILGVKTWGVAYRCSECGFVHSVIEDFGHYTFCPRCGAKIDEVEE